MALETVGTGAHANLQSVIEAARLRAKNQEVREAAGSAEPETVRVPKSAAGGSVFERLYGAKVEQKQAEPVRLGTRFDQYA